MSQQQQQQRLRVGYALSLKKYKTFILPSLINHASQNNIDLIPIDTSKPLLSQSPFDCIIHKLYSPDWTNQLDNFSQKYPFVPIIDQPRNIEKLHNRISMLDALTHLEIDPKKSRGSIGIPSQVVVFEENELLGLKEIKFPVVAKPLVADGSASSHEMFLVLSSAGFRKLSFPVVLQEFVNHGGVVFKVYVVGEHVECVKRKSLPDIDGREFEEEGAVLFSRVSNLAGGDGDGDGDEENAVMPPLEFVESLASGLRGKLGLSLFNFDLIRGASDQDRYFVIDINYFPGYAKMPNYEQVLVKFFRDSVIKGKGLGRDGGDVKESEVGFAGDCGQDIL